MKWIGKKMKMSQLWLDDKLTVITPIRIDDGAPDLSAVKLGDYVNAVGISKGHGFQGVVKRHGFAGGPKTHGQKHHLRAPGSIGSTALQRVVPGRKMGGHMGQDRVTIKNLRVAKLDFDKKIIFLKGAIPGNEDGKIEIYQK